MQRDTLLPRVDLLNLVRVGSGTILFSYAGVAQFGRVAVL